MAGKAGENLVNVGRCAEVPGEARIQEQYPEVLGVVVPGTSQPGMIICDSTTA